MKILFLDIDGVLNSQAYWRRRPVIYRKRIHDLDREAMARLNTVLDRTGATVVVSSTWRIGHSRVELQQMLNAYGFTGTVFGKTGTGKDRKKLRGLEIQAWLDTHGSVGADKGFKHHIESFAIVDDDSDMAHLMDHLVHTTNQDGLQDEHVEVLVRMLGEKL